MVYRLVHVEHTPTEYGGAFALISRERLQVIFVSSDRWPVVWRHGHLRYVRSSRQFRSLATSAVDHPIGTELGHNEAGLVASLARPGGKITGLTANSGPEIEAKRLQLLKEAAPATGL